MKTLVQTIVLSALMVLLLNSKIFAQNRKLSLVKLEWQNFSTQTFHDVDCDSFRSLFKKTIENKSFGDSLYLRKFDQLMKCFRKERKYKTIDVRGIITLNYQQTKIEYCFDIFGHFYKDGVISYNKQLIDFITKNLYSKHFTR